MRQYWVYIMTNKHNTVLYTGVTNNLRRRVEQHKGRKGSRFTAKYKVTKLVFYEGFSRVTDAIAAEKRIKAGSRAKKIEVVESTNPEWQDLYESLGGDCFVPINHIGTRNDVPHTSSLRGVRQQRTTKQSSGR